MEIPLCFNVKFDGTYVSNFCLNKKAAYQVHFPLHFIEERGGESGVELPDVMLLVFSKYSNQAYICKYLFQSP